MQYTHLMAMFSIDSSCWDLPLWCRYTHIVVSTPCSLQRGPDMNRMWDNFQAVPEPFARIVTSEPVRLTLFKGKERVISPSQAGQISETDFAQMYSVSIHLLSASAVQHLSLTHQCTQQERVYAPAITQSCTAAPYVLAQDVVHGNIAPSCVQTSCGHNVILHKSLVNRYHLSIFLIQGNVCVCVCVCRIMHKPWGTASWTSSKTATALPSSSYAAWCWSGSSSLYPLP